MAVKGASGPGGAAPTDGGGPDAGKDAGGGAKGDGISAEDYAKLGDKEKQDYIEDPNNPGQYLKNPDV